MPLVNVIVMHIRRIRQIQIVAVVVVIPERSAHIVTIKNYMYRIFVGIPSEPFFTIVPVIINKIVDTRAVVLEVVCIGIARINRKASRLN